MARRIIHIEPTDAQWETIDELTAPGTAFVANQTDEQGEPTGELWLERTIDDRQVRLYSIAADGSFTYEELEGLGYGWRQFDEHGTEIVSDDE
ncbi:hypothetical protein [Leucobacter luti]|uniref:YD repeat-containing protein n=1 Tax=Leucobacter luti TaxID=340320 RepID=A0A4Q7TZH2_9MICO|nr:hypothetical protein [Leucobacter luti]MBL3698994.1 hypothetical protein [Leucobacter luti]RZT66373.1 hypothetical protein EV139_1810 [Leucobacter luti]